ncbi:hypothetical protein GP486_003027 [Trichoglossum hirsutum]|uniref:DNA helicase n=1 Tax=Trichoglossum hirsutum TaxID=265104 RepID=A0A9P8RR65_9PEZI|nr:hypothetical protein GP486_003027 [Trichoglossum hirsutum]
MAPGWLLDIDTVPDSPAKRQKTDSSKGDRHGYNSLSDSGDDLFDDFDTLATVPLPKQTALQDISLGTQPKVAPQRLGGDGVSQRKASQSQGIARQTQALNGSITRLDSSGRKPSIVQVAASSPLREPSRPPPVRSNGPSGRGGGVLASAMAPPGTEFRLPYGVRKADSKPVVIDLSDDDGPRYRGGSSDEDASIRRTTDIKPSMFGTTRSMQRMDTATDCIEESPNIELNKFKEITGSSFYRPLDKSKPRGSNLAGPVFDSRKRDEKPTSSGSTASTGPNKRPTGSTAALFASNGRSPKQPRQSGPERARLVEDLPLEDIRDFHLRESVERMRAVLPDSTNLKCRNALLLKKGNFGDAMEFLVSQEEHTERVEVDLTVSDEEKPRKRTLAPFMFTSKRQVKAPNRTIHDKWSSTQALPNLPQASPATTPKKPKRKLVRGRKELSSPVVQSIRSPPVQTIESCDDSDSGIDPEPEEDDKLEGEVLDFFNTCSIKDLADIANTTEETANVVLSQKPFATLEDVRQVSSDIPANTRTGKRKAPKKTIGDRIVNICLEMWTGYEAVDALVSQCEALGKPLAKAMEEWGVDVFGTTKGGELELLSFSNTQDTMTDPQSVRDSGIGTPSDSTLASGEEGDGDIKISPTSRVAKVNKDIYVKQPSTMGKDIVLKDYQLVGLNWLVLLFKHKLSCILADEMGLGKTCQVISFLVHLLEHKDIRGPHLVVVPSSTLENWLREFRRFSPSLIVEPYYGLQKERVEQRDRIDRNRDHINVIVTTYQTASGNQLDSKFLRSQKPVVCVYDEGHYLKNSNSSRYANLMRIPAEFRVLLTGTPLQNNLQELASLLSFILPSVFKERKEDLAYIFKHKAKTTDDSHDALLSAQRIARAKSMLTPFVLRRKKHQVLRDLPGKTCSVVYCEPTTSQWEIYSDELLRAREAMEARAAGQTTKDQNNVMMQLRKAAIHPLLFRRLFDDDKIRNMSKACLMEPQWSDRDEDLVREDMEYMSDFELYRFCTNYPNTMSRYNLQDDEWMDSGKVQKLCELLLAYRANGDRVLVFSQFTLVLDILEAVLETLTMQYFRLDGSTKVQERQDMIDQFHEEKDITVFLLSTKAGGSGINLTCANKVIIFDLSFNPQDDLQAENRAHRVGQEREVEVLRLVTKGTIEEQILALGETKLALDSRVVGEGIDEKEAKQAELKSEEMVAKMMLEQVKELDGAEAEKKEAVKGE